MKIASSTPVLVAVAWPYASGPRHLGHVAGFGVPSDIFARYHRLKASRVLMVSGTDEHGTPITIAADREGIGPRAVADRYSAVIMEDLQRLGLSYDLFTRTTTQNHYAVVQEVFRSLYGRAYLPKKTALGAFSPATGRTLPDRYIEGTVPNAVFETRRAGRSVRQLRQPAGADGSHRPAVQDRRDRAGVQGDGTLLPRLPALAGELAPWIAAHEQWRPNVRGFALSLVQDLHPRAVTRDIDWGVHIPLPEYDGRPDKRIYVWFDAVIGYLSASIEWARASGTPDA